MKIKCSIDLLGRAGEDNILFFQIVQYQPIRELGINESNNTMACHGKSNLEQFIEC